MEERERYAGNMQAFSAEELATVRTKNVCIIGCGGLGGYVCNGLARFGVGRLTLVDGDHFSVGNLNRQLFATRKTLGQNKAAATQAALEEINDEVQVAVHEVMLCEQNAAEILAGHHLVVDCLDSPQARLMLGRHCAQLGIPMVHGALGGFYGQVANVFPGDTLLSVLYAQQENGPVGLEKKWGNPVFTVQVVASVQCSEALKLLAEKEPYLRNQLLYIDLLNNSFDLVEFA